MGYRRSLLATASAVAVGSVWFSPAQAAITNPATAAIDASAPAQRAISAPDPWFRFLLLTNGTYNPDVVESAVRTIFSGGVAAQSSGDLRNFVRRVEALGVPAESVRVVRYALEEMLPSETDSEELWRAISGATSGGLAGSYRLAQLAVADGICGDDPADVDCPPQIVGAVGPAAPAGGVGAGGNVSPGTNASPGGSYSN